MINPDRNLYEPPYDDALLYESDLEPERPRSRPLVVLLGIVVLAAFAGVVWVAYNQGVKQGQRGAPPILAADSGPTRITPDQTAVAQNGDPAPDKSYDRLLGEAPEQEDNILPAPEQPRTVPAPQELAATERPAPTEATGGPLETKATDVTPPDPRLDSTVGVENLTEAVPSGAAPVAAPPPAKIAAAQPKVVTVPVTQPSGPVANDAMPSSMSPVEAVPAPAAPKQLVAAAPAQPKPAVAKPSVVQPSAPKAAAVKLPPVQPAPVPAEATVAAEPPAAAETQMAALSPPPESSAPSPAATGGGVMIQLGSFPNDGLAAGAWSKIKSTNTELLGSYSPQIKAAEIPGKGTWYRLRVGGFPDKAAASQVCEQLKAGGQACIIALK